MLTPFFFLILTLMSAAAFRKYDHPNLTSRHPAQISGVVKNNQQDQQLYEGPECEAIDEGLFLATAPRSPWPTPSAAALREEGCIYVPYVISNDTANTLRVHCANKLADNLASVASGAAFFSDCFGTVRARKARHDLKLGLASQAVADAMAEALLVLGPLLRGALGCDEPHLASLVRIRIKACKCLFSC
jgi:hypothetical protein